MKDFKGLNPGDYLRIFWRRKWYFVATFLLVGCAGGIYAWRLPNVYRSESKILIERALVPQDFVQPSDRSSPAERMAAIRDQVQSRSFTERLIQEFQLMGYGTDQKFSMDNAVEAVSKVIRVTTSSQNIFTISYAATDAQLAQSLTRRLVEILIQTNTASRRTKAVEAEGFLDEQLRQAERDLSANEGKIKQFKTEHLGELPEQSAVNMNALSGMQAQLAAAENALQRARDQRKLLDFRVQQRKRLNLLSRSITPPSPSMPAPESKKKEINASDALLAAKQTLLAEMTAKYTPRHPDVIRLSTEVEELKQKIALAARENEKPGSDAELTPLGQSEKQAAPPQAAAAGKASDELSEIEAAEIKLETESINNEIAKREKEKEEILRQIRILQGRLNLAPSLEQELMALSRENDTLKQQCSNLQNKKFQAQMTAKMETDKNNETYQVIDAANLPEKPAFPNRAQIVLLGLGAAVLAGIGAAFGREFLDPTLASEQEAAAVLNLPVLISIPEIPNIRGRRLIGGGRAAKSA